MSKFTYGTIEVDTSAFAPASIEALVRRGVAHYLGNEQASKVVAWAKTKATEGLAAYLQTDPDNSAGKTVEDFEPSLEDKQSKKEELQQAALGHLVAGTIGISAPRTPSVDPLEAAMERLAKAQVTTVLKANGIKPPKDGESVTFGDGTKKTMDDMIATRLAHATHGPAIRAEAEKVLKAKAKEAAAKAKALASQKVEGPISADNLGL